LPTICADELRLKQVVINLLANAIKFTPPQGSVVVAARCVSDGGVMIEVKDTGIGMSSDEIEVALKRFGQVDHGINRKFEGTGLGLPLAQGLVELHGGTLTIASVPKVGTTVRIVLPASRVSVDEPSVERRSA
jgi:signal transduction histidine kinase